MKRDRREFLKKAGWTFIGSGLYINLFSLDTVLAGSDCTAIRNLYAFIVKTETCIGCELCPETCPEVFEMNDEGKAQVKVAVVPSGAEGSCRDAADECPVEALTITD